MSSLSVFELKGLGSRGDSKTLVVGSPSSSAQQSTSTSSNNSTIGGIPPDSTTTQQQSKISQQSHSSNTNNSSNMYSLKWNTQLLSLQRSLAQLWDSGIGTDAVLLCQGTPLPVHKIILTAASPYVASVVQTMVSASHMMPVIVVDISADAGKALLSFLYCGEAHVPVSVIPQLVAGAKFLGISGFAEPGVLESLTGMVPESAPSPSIEKSQQVKYEKEESITTGGYLDRLGSGVHISSVPSPSPTPSVQSSHSNYSYNSGSGSTGRIGRNAGNTNSNVSGGDRSKSSSPFPPPPAFLETLKLSRISPNHRNTRESTTKSSRLQFLGNSGSILDNLLKNPRHSNQSGNGTFTNSEGPVNLSCNNSVVGDEEENEYAGDGNGIYGSGSGTHFILQDGGDDESEGDVETDGPIPQQLLEPNVEYHFGSTDRGSSGSTESFNNGNVGRERNIGLPLSIQNPLIDLAKVASAMQQQTHRIVGHHIPLSEPSTTRGVKRKPRVQHDPNTGDVISSTPTNQKQSKPKKPQEAIICDICNKKFSNAYNLRVHMEGHSGQVFVCSVCSHASRSRDALRKHFAYRHRELWVRGMSAFRKGTTTGVAVPTRKLSVTKADTGNVSKIEEDEPNNNLIDSNGNINVRGGGSDGTLTISEAFPATPTVKTEN